MKTLLAAGGFGISFLGIIGALGWVLAIGIAIILPGGSLLILAAHYWNGRSRRQKFPVASLEALRIS